MARAIHTHAMTIASADSARVSTTVRKRSERRHSTVTRSGQDRQSTMAMRPVAGAVRAGGTRPTPGRRRGSRRRAPS